MANEDQAIPAGAVNAPTLPPSPRGRRRGLLGLSALVVLGAIGWGAWWALTQRHHEHTDNAYVQAPVVQITPQVGGTVLAVAVDDTDRVKPGQVLLELDASDAKLALQRAEAQLAQTVREVRTVYTQNDTLQAQVALREADLARVGVDLRRASGDVARRRALVGSGAVSGEEMKHAEDALAAVTQAQFGARAALAAAREQAQANRALTDGVPAAENANVQRASAAVREAWLAVERARVLAPIEGQVARRNVQVGQRIAAGTPVMSVVPLDQVWVEANFKEPQLRRMRVGQPVRLHADLYGKDVTYRGKIVGVGAGTGAAFAMLPPQNATGNWIKVVQRVPVRVELDAAELAAHPLRVGLSMEAEVDVAQGEGAPVLAQPVAPRMPARSAAPLPEAAKADELVQRIIRQNLGAAAGATASGPSSARRG